MVMLAMEDPIGVKRPKYHPSIDKWVVLYFSEMQPSIPSREEFDSFEEAQEWAAWKAELMRVELED